MVADLRATIRAVWSSWVVTRADTAVLNAQDSMSALKAETRAVATESVDPTEPGGSSSTGPSPVDMTGGIADLVTGAGGVIGGAESSSAVSPHTHTEESVGT